MPQTRAGAASTMHSMARMPSRRTAAPPAQVRTTRYAVSQSSGRAMLDETVPLASGSHRDVVSYSVEGANLLVRLRDGTSTGLARPAQFAGYRGEASAPIVMKLMTHHRVRHMPVLRDGKLAGIISIGDVM